MWLINSSVGRKVIMSITGLALILFLTFHMAMNLTAIVSEEAYNAICAFLGANWYALVGTMGLAALVAVHVIYALWLTIRNRKARGNESYSVTAKPKNVEWASQNMLVLGIIIILGLGLHLFNFWYNMQFAELRGLHETNGLSPTDGAGFIGKTFACPVYAGLYLIWLAAIWFHLTHGFWSALQTLGLNNKIWFNRWKIIAYIYSTLLMAGFAAVVVWYYVKSLLCGTCCTV
ncbi:succinate dehydrogenase/fumarate reductase cytochrome b subunit [termite gut metagenome]|uniref:Succinate dehydrogenase/fumarate reductase cytochrome b subunit n=2 Tax=termite gut metagenome TaxID=433724 RepID=A0A5J4T0T6_9ZZZZ